MYLHFYSSSTYIKKFLAQNFENIKNTITLNYIDIKEKIKKVLKILFPNISNLKDIKKTLITSIKNGMLKDWNIDFKKTAKRFVMFIQSNIEKIEYDNPINLKNDLYNIEHIIPKNSKFIKTEDNDKALEETMLWLKNVNKMSNFLLIEKTLNEYLENKSFKEKKNIFLKKGSKLKIVEEVFKNEKFNQDTIDNRSKDLVNSVEKIVKHYFDIIYLR